jgi:hypothetical protein
MAQALDGPVGTNRIRAYNGPAGTGYGLAVAQGADDNSVVLPAAGHRCLGITVEPDTNLTGLLGVARDGEVPAIIGAAVEADQDLIADAAGRLVPSVTDGDQVIARAITSGAALGDEIIVEITKFVK